ncbi:MAG: thiopurine S-methyltransferase [Pseudomonadota bacterium]
MTDQVMQEELNFWLQRWENHEIGFHQNAFNPWLVKHANQELGVQGNNVFVPLCGKSLDMLFLLHQGYSIIGVDISRRAIEAFFEENNLSIETVIEHHFGREYRCESIRLFAADIFDLPEEIVASADSFYDRAALIALPEVTRISYINYFKRCLHNKPGLLLTLAYEQEVMPGPPFSVTKEWLQKQEAIDELHIIEQKNIIDDEPRFQQKGLSELYATLYRMTYCL